MSRVASVRSEARVRRWRLISMVAERAVRRALDDLLDAEAGGVLQVTGQGPEQRAQAHGRRADLVQDPHDLSLGCRLHDACQDHRAEPVIARHVERQPRIRAGQDRPQQISGRPCDPPARSDRAGTPTGRRLRRLQRQLRFASPVRDLVHPRRDHRQDPQVQDVLTRGQPLTRGCQQQREPGASVCADPTCSIRSTCRPRRVTT
jgi:hypothetical protein